MIRQGLFSLLMALSISSIASNSQDVIYKKDGSILKGILIEQDFETGQYKIQLGGGSIFVVSKEDINKITKEAIPSNQVEQELEALAAESRSKSIQANTFSPIAAKEAELFQPLATDAVFYIGTLSHIIRFEFDDPYVGTVEEITRYQGIKLGAQKNYSEHLAAQINLNSGKLDSIEFVDENGYILQSYSDSELIDESYLGLSASIIASTNLQRGWQFYTGLGIQRDEYSSDFGDVTFTSLGLELGMGYSWQSLQLALQYQGILTGDYPSELSVGNLNLQLGVNFN
jgi:hypothetical protein